jgi:hypothetical protein
MTDIPKETCRACKQEKERFLFTPSQLKMTNPKCRACISEEGSRGTDTPRGAAWRGKLLLPGAVL